ncbi:TonB-dependent receptor domain-containing protein [Brevundimonas staleyi]|uniref:TonB-dependent receptor domain-containing protein n=1 Tax=Brevundimonas staleyi TaxID=74326 RepID=A0ABW0FXC5_9CAUL
MHNHHSLLGGTAFAVVVAAAGLAVAQPATHDFNIPSQDLASALQAYSRVTREQIVFDNQRTAGRVSAAVVGRYTTEEALRRLLAGTGLSVRRGSSGVLMVVSGAPAQSEAASVELDEILVTGSRIRGGITASPVITTTRDDIRNAGHTDLGEVIRSIPQNYAGGQNPGVTQAGGITNQNVTGGSALNLRGLGPDATLTLLNGRRLSYGGANQAVDVSSIPVAAIDRIEIITDGASALYGSDAVAGVANIILRQDFEGLELSGRVGAATDGGFEQYQLSATVGRKWEGGAVLLAYDRQDQGAILAGDRDYLDHMLDVTEIYSPSEHHALLLSGHQAIGPSLTGRLDLVYLDRLSTTYTLDSGQENTSTRDVTSFTLSPSLEIRLPADWTGVVSGTYSEDETLSYQTAVTSDGTVLADYENCHCNRAASGEISAEGPVLALPGGDLRLALGAGIRRNDYVSRRTYPAVTTPPSTKGDRTGRYAFLEANAPLVSPGQEVAGIYRLTFNAAARYESYEQLGDVLTPKVGLLYDPTSEISLRATWGQSFKAPTLQHEFSSQIAALYPASFFGATGYPANATVIFMNGGGGQLAPERAETTSFGAVYTPRALPGLRLGATYFDIDYTDRSIQPIQNAALVFPDSNWARFLTRDPSPGQQAALIAGTNRALFNVSGFPYDPALVAGIVDNRYTNVARQTAQGIDLDASYRRDLAGGEATFSATATWLETNQQNGPGVPLFETSGDIFYPTDFRARAGVVWTGGALTLGGFVNHVAGVRNTQLTPPETGDGFTTVDVTARHQFAPGDAPWSGLELGLSVSNLFDTAPPITPSPYDFVVNYDSTNYSAIGRYVSLSLTRRW